MYWKKKNITEMNYKKNWLQFKSEIKILCKYINSISFNKNEIRITSRLFLALNQERGLFLFLGLGNKNLFWYHCENENCIVFPKSRYLNLNPERIFRKWQTRRTYAWKWPDWKRRIRRNGGIRGIFQLPQYVVRCAIW